MDIYHQLKIDHQTIEQILEELKHSGTNPDPDARRDILLRLKLAWQPHAQSEQKILYANLHNEGIDQLLEQATQEHRDIDLIILELEKSDPATDEWMVEVGVLDESLRQHMNQEETELFVRAKNLIDATHAQELLFEYDAEKQDEIENMGYPP